MDPEVGLLSPAISCMGKSIDARRNSKKLTNGRGKKHEARNFIKNNAQSKADLQQSSFPTSTPSKYQPETAQVRESHTILLDKEAFQQLQALT